MGLASKLAKGGLFTLSTIMEIFSESEAKPSVTVNVTSYAPCWLKSGVQVNVLVAWLKLAPVGRLDAWYVSASPSISVAEMVNVRVVFSLMVLLPIRASSGGLLTLLTVILTSSESERFTSLAVNVTLYGSTLAWV